MNPPDNRPNSMSSIYSKPLNNQQRNFLKKVIIKRSNQPLFTLDVPLLPISFFKTALKKYYHKRILKVKPADTILPCSASYFLRSLKTLTFSADYHQFSNTKWYKNKLKGAFMNCQGVQKMTILNSASNSLFFSYIGYVKKLQCLEITITDDKIIENTKLFKELFSLEKVDLKVYGKNIIFDSQDNIALISVFFKNLLALPRLKVLNLTILDLLYNTDLETLETLLEYVGDSQVKCFNIYVKFSLYKKVGAKKASKFLEKVEFLALMDNMPTNSLIYETRKFQKTFCLNLNGLSRHSVGSIISGCKALQSLWLDSEYFQIKDFKCASSLRELNIKCNKIGSFIAELTNAFRNVKSLERFFLEMTQLTKKSIRDLSCFYQLACMRSLKNYSLKIFFVNTLQLKNIYRKFLAVFPAQMSYLKTIEKLCLHFKGDVSYPKLFFGNSFVPLKNLKDLDVLISDNFYCCTDSLKYQMDFELFLEKLSQLSSLRLNFEHSLSHDCAVRLLESVSKMKQLKILVIQGHCLFSINWDKNKIFENLFGLQSLEHLELQFEGRQYSIKDLYCNMEF